MESSISSIVATDALSISKEEIETLLCLSLLRHDYLSKAVNCIWESLSTDQSKHALSPNGVGSPGPFDSTLVVATSSSHSPLSQNDIRPGPNGSVPSSDDPSTTIANLTGDMSAAFLEHTLAGGGSGEAAARSAGLSKSSSSLSPLQPSPNNQQPSFLPPASRVGAAVPSAQLSPLVLRLLLWWATAPKAPFFSDEVEAKLHLRHLASSPLRLSSSDASFVAPSQLRWRIARIFSVLASRGCVPVISDALIYARQVDASEMAVRRCGMIFDDEVAKKKDVATADDIASSLLSSPLLDVSALLHALLRLHVDDQAEPGDAVVAGTLLRVLLTSPRLHRRVVGQSFQVPADRNEALLVKPLMEEDRDFGAGGANQDIVTALSPCTVHFNPILCIQAWETLTSLLCPSLLLSDAAEVLLLLPHHPVQRLLVTAMRVEGHSNTIEKPADGTRSTDEVEKPNRPRTHPLARNQALALLYTLCTHRSLSATAQRTFWSSPALLVAVLRLAAFFPSPLLLCSAEPFLSCDPVADAALLHRVLALYVVRSQQLPPNSPMLLLLRQNCSAIEWCLSGGRGGSKTHRNDGREAHLTTDVAMWAGSNLPEAADDVQRALAVLRATR